MHIRFNDLIIRNVSCSFLLHIKYENFKGNVLTKKSVSSKYSLKVKSNVNDILN